MPDPAQALRELEQLRDLPQDEWQQVLAAHGVPQPHREDVLAGQALLREALAGGGTSHDVLGRMGRTVLALRKTDAERAALAALKAARGASRRRLEMALSLFPMPDAAGSDPRSA